MGKTGLGRFTQTLDSNIEKQLKEYAEKRGYTIQELIKVLIIPDWIEHNLKNT